jgi:DNA-binding GntR family transcriptional regulator
MAKDGSTLARRRGPRSEEGRTGRGNSAGRDGAPRPRASAARPVAASVDDIAERVLAAIMEHRLPPGTQLVEERMGAIFSVSRTKIRQALARLAHDNLLSVFPNRGTFVASPTVEEARQVFDARRLLEPGIVRAVAGQATREQVARLRRITKLEATAREANDRRATIRLSGEFHIELAELTGTPFVVKSLRELALLTCLLIALYDSPAVQACPHHEHGEILDAIQARDVARAASLMVTHLDHVERALELSPPASGDIDLEAALAAT